MLNTEPQPINTQKLLFDLKDVLNEATWATSDSMESLQGRLNIIRDTVGFMLNDLEWRVK